MSDQAINSTAYWDNRFEADWEAKDGPAQTRFFCRLAAANMPGWLTHAVRAEGWSVCDWGCALGDGTDLLEQLMAPAQAIGVDISSRAVEQARRRYPRLNFEAMDLVEKPAPRAFDLVFSSNTIEHFDRPWKVLEKVAASAARAVVVMMPANEFERHSEHFATFTPANVPLQLGDDLALVGARLFDTGKVSGTYWSGQQFLLTYLRRAEIAARGLTLADLPGALEPELPGALDGTWTSPAAILRGEIVKEQALAAASQAAMDVATARIGALEERLAGRAAQHDAMQAELKQERAAAEELRAQLEELRAQLEELRAQLSARSDELRLAREAAGAAQAEAGTSSAGWSVAHAAAERLHESAERWRGRALALEASTSWRITGPLRRVVTTLKRQGHERALPPVPEIPPVPERAASVGGAGATGPRVASLEIQIEAMRARLTSGVRRGLTIVTCGFDFDITVNQRPINIAREAAASGHAVIFVAWEWAPDQPSALRNRLFEGDILQVGRFDFTGRPELFNGLVSAAEEAVYILSVPSRDLNDAAHALRGAGAAIVYDIMDDWEEFAAVGQAPWFEKSVEENAVLSADVVTAVSPPLAAKFAFARHDVTVIANGFSPRVLGAKPGLRVAAREGERLRAGYFGHLTDSWFNWELIFEALEAAPELEVEVIGYGEPEWVRTRAAAQPRLTFLGKRSPSDLLRLSHGWHVAMIPFKSGTLAEAVDPIKIYEYLYFRLPVAVTGILHVASYPATRVATDVAEFIAALRDLGRDAGRFDQDAVDAFLSSATWRSRYRALLDRAQRQRPLGELFGNAAR
jgi:tRNA G46 methylase TrmB